MNELQSAVSTGAMLGNLPTASLLGILVIILGIIAYRTYNEGIREHGEKLDKITTATEKMVQETHDLNITTKASLASAKETRDYLIKANETQNKQTQDKIDAIEKKIDLEIKNVKRINGKLEWVDDKQS